MDNQIIDKLNTLEDKFEKMNLEIRDKLLFLDYRLQKIENFEKFKNLKIKEFNERNQLNNDLNYII